MFLYQPDWATLSLPMPDDPKREKSVKGKTVAAGRRRLRVFALETTEKRTKREREEKKLIENKELLRSMVHLLGRSTTLGIARGSLLSSQRRRGERERKRG